MPRAARVGQRTTITRVQRNEETRLHEVERIGRTLFPQLPDQRQRAASLWDDGLELRQNLRFYEVIDGHFPIINPLLAHMPALILQCLFYGTYAVEARSRSPTGVTAMD